MKHRGVLERSKMKQGTLDKLKFQKLQRRLKESTRGTVGLLEMLWLGTATNCPEGDIGRFTNEEIAIICDWDGDPDQLVTGLVGCGWLDESVEHRLVVHDWEDHCPSFVKGSLARHGRSFAGTKEPAKEATERSGHPAKEVPKHVADPTKQPAKEPAEPARQPAKEVPKKAPKEAEQPTTYPILSNPILSNSIHPPHSLG